MLNVFAKLDGEDKNKLSLSTVKKYPLDVFIDNDSAPAKILDAKKDDIFDADDAADLPAMTQGFTSRKRATEAPCPLTTAQRLDTLLQETPPATMPSARLFELRSVVLTGLGPSAARALFYEGCAKCKKKMDKCAGTCQPGATIQLHAFCPAAELTDWSGTAANVLVSGDQFLTLTDLCSAEQARKIATRNTNALTFRAFAHVRISISIDEYNNARRYRARIAHAEKQIFDKDTGDSPLRLQRSVGLGTNVIFAGLDDVNLLGDEIQIGGHPCTYVTLYVVGDDEPDLEEQGPAFRMTNKVKAARNFDSETGKPTGGYAYLHLSATCAIQDLVRMKIGKGAHAFATVDTFDAPDCNPRVANVVSITLIRGDAQAGIDTSICNFGLETCRIADSLKREADDAEEFIEAATFLAKPRLKRAKSNAE